MISNKFENSSYDIKLIGDFSAQSAGAVEYSDCISAAR